MSDRFINLFEKVSGRGSMVGGPFMRLVAASYQLAPSSEPEAVKLFSILAEKIRKQHKQLQSRYQFAPTMADPYRSMKHMTQEIDKQRDAGVRKPEVKVLAAPPEGGHPAIDNDTNVVFRWVHDLIAHHAGQHPFSARGEFAAYNRHLKTLPPSVAPILFTEIIGQTSVYKVYGDYTVQKAAFLRDFNPFRIGELAADSPLNNFFAFENKALVPRPDFNWERFSQAVPALAKELASQPSFDPTFSGQTGTSHK